MLLVCVVVVVVLIGMLCLMLLLLLFCAATAVLYTPLLPTAVHSRLNPSCDHALYEYDWIAQVLELMGASNVRERKYGVRAVLPVSVSCTISALVFGNGCGSV